MFKVPPYWGVLVPGLDVGGFVVVVVVGFEVAVVVVVVVVPEPHDMRTRDVINRKPIMRPKRLLFMFPSLFNFSGYYSAAPVVHAFTKRQISRKNNQDVSPTDI